MRQVEAILKVRIKFEYNPLYEDAFDAALRAYKDGDAREFDVEVEELAEEDKEGPDPMDRSHWDKESA